jgi:hypothetical protein
LDISKLYNSKLYSTIAMNTKIGEVRLIELLPVRNDKPVSRVLSSSRRVFPSESMAGAVLAVDKPKPKHVVFIKDLTINVQEHLLA